ncbi:MAG: hypothetical protein NZL83_02395 [Candidatus Absconditabacterales bacterium]|nr:hypothetical protein [Candidatus Absconditabacterales bacterium]
MTIQYEKREWGQGKTLYVVDMKKESSKNTLSALTQATIDSYAPNHHLLLIGSKQSYHNVRLCNACGAMPTCHHCDNVLHYEKQHQDIFVALCSICHTHYPLSDQCESCKKKDTLTFVGYGLNHLYEHLSIQGYHPLILNAKTTNSRSKIMHLRHKWEQHPVIFCATSLGFAPPPCPLKASCILDADLFFRLGDHAHISHGRWSLYNHCLRGPNHIIIQTINPHNPLLLMLLRRKPDEFTEYCNTNAKMLGLPPFGEECLISLHHHDPLHLKKKVDTITKHLRYWQAKLQSSLMIFQTPPAKHKIRGQYLYHIVIRGHNIRPFMDAIVWESAIATQGRNIHRQPRNIT